MKDFLSAHKLLLLITLAIIALFLVDFIQYKGYTKTLQSEISKKQSSNVYLFKEFSSLEGLNPTEKLDASLALLQKYQTYPAAYLALSNSTIELLYFRPQLYLSSLTPSEKLVLEEKTLKNAKLILELYKDNYKTMYSLEEQQEKALKENPGLSSWLTSKNAEPKIYAINKALDDNIKNHLSQLDLRYMARWQKYYRDNELYINSNAPELNNASSSRAPSMPLINLVSINNGLAPGLIKEVSFSDNNGDETSPRYPAIRPSTTLK